MLVPPAYANVTPSHNLHIAFLCFFPASSTTSVSSKNSQTALVRLFVDIDIDIASADEQLWMYCAAQTFGWRFRLRIVCYQSNTRTNQTFVATLHFTYTKKLILHLVTFSRSQVVCNGLSTWLTSGHIILCSDPTFSQKMFMQ